MNDRQLFIEASQPIRRHGDVVGVICDCGREIDVAPRVGLSRHGTDNKSGSDAVVLLQELQNPWVVS